MKSKDGKCEKLYKREKYGIDAKITEINCENTVPVRCRIFPSPRKCIRENEVQGADFLVAISGQKKNTDGLIIISFRRLPQHLHKKCITSQDFTQRVTMYAEYGTVKWKKWIHIL